MRYTFLASNMFLSTLISMSSLGAQSVCGVDDRTPSFENHVGHVRASNGDTLGRFCTVTLISESCALTAGHCLHVLDEAEFFDANLSAQGWSQDLNSNKYRVDKGSVRALQSRIGNDWAVVRLQPNPLSGMLPGKVHGFAEIDLDPQLALEGELEIHSIQRDEKGQFGRVSARGTALSSDGSILFHDLDTGPGSSGSLISAAASGRAVAIHTHGGCDTMKNNKATVIARVPYLVKAIRACVAQESK
ncbi:MAG: hypothetical protein RI932_1214 [Pseudomonadota bacterium]